MRFTVLSLHLYNSAEHVDYFLNYILNATSRIDDLGGWLVFRLYQWILYKWNRYDVSWQCCS